jgi:hypothetical protein
VTISFTTFVLSLSTAALQHLGVSAAGEEQEKPEVNLPAAQQTIDILEMLEEKTKGNLTDEEGQLLGTLLYDLRMRFVEASRGAGS